MKHAIRPGIHRTGAVLLTFLSLGGARPVKGQEPTDSLRAEVRRLAEVVDSLSREVARLRAQGLEPEAEAAEDALARLRAAAEEVAGEPSPDEQEPEEFVGRQRSLQALNPEISLNADVLAHVDPDDPGRDNFFWREFELSLQSALDPFARAALFISRHGDGPEVAAFGGGHDHDAAEGEAEDEEHDHGGGFDIEEGYLEWVSLPGGFRLKFGKFFQRFGTVNRWHAHALPFQSRSLPHLAILGEGALSQTGVSLTWLAPLGGGGSGTYEATVEVTRSENDVLFGGSHRVSVLGHVNGFWQLSRAVDLDLGLSWLRGRYEGTGDPFSRNVYNIEAALTWLEPSRSRQSGVIIRGGYMLLDGLIMEEPAPAAGGSAGGFWSTAELRLSPSWLVGARFDRTENPSEPDVTQWLVSPTLTWWQSEFVRVRAEYDFLGGFEDQPRSGMFVLQVTFGMGPHKHETY